MFIYSFLYLAWVGLGKRKMQKFETTRTRNSTILFLGVWILYALFLIIQHKFVFFHFDDFGYASLSYGTNDANLHGRNWDITDLYRFLRWHYFNWGGRVLFYGLGALISRVGEWFIQLIQAVIIFAITVLIYKLIQRKQYDLPAAWISVILYGMMCLQVFSDGIFWYAASEGYIWPFLFLFSAILMTEKRKNKGNAPLASLLFFIAGFSHEQIAFLTIIYCVIMLFFQMKDRNSTERIRNSIIIYGCGIIGALIEILAPGNFARSENSLYQNFYRLTFFEKIWRNLPEIYFKNLGNIYSLLLLLLSLWLSFIFLTKKRKSLNFGLLVFNACVSITSIILLNDDSNLKFLIVCDSLLLIVYFYQIGSYLLYEKKNFLFALFLGGVLSQGMMIVSPSIDYRSTIPFQIVLHLIFSDIILYSLDNFHQRLTKVCICGITALSTYNICFITEGYYRNSSINLINRYKLCEKSRLIQEGVPIDTILLYRLPDDRFSSQMPYHQAFISDWVKNYYELPQNIKFVWQDSSFRGNAYEEVIFEDPEIKSLWPEVIDSNTSRGEDGGVDIAVIPFAMDNNTIILVNGMQMDTTFNSDGFYSTHITEDLLINDIKIELLDTFSGKKSNCMIMKVKK